MDITSGDELISIFATSSETYKKETNSKTTNENRIRGCL